MLRIVGVHGVGNLRPGRTAEVAGRQLSAIWRRHLGRGPIGLPAYEFEISMAYYADHLAAGAQGVDDSLETLPADAEAMVRAWIGELALPADQPQGLATWPVRQMVGWLAERRHISPALTELFVSRFFREVAAYFRPGPARVAARETVSYAIREQRPDVVIAHSLGSVVAYEALWHDPQPEVQLLVTLGSPLALPHAVYPRLSPSTDGGGGGRPPGVRRWVNIADPGDLVALPARGISRGFSPVDADLYDVVHAFDFHLVANYLACDRLADTLKGA
ncbi:serine peptidase [Streptomyces sp. NPDC060275]|uniref:serine peptidase n=1 Tax=Streptomyces sp. NPDC060275 TaxID=3347090 RepID=UPI0036572A03